MSDQLLESIQTLKNDYSLVLFESRKVIRQIKNEVYVLWNILSELKMLNNKSWRFQWRMVSTGYAFRAGLYERLGFWRKRIVLYDIEDSDCYEMLLEKNDSSIFDAIIEASLHIKNKIVAMKRSVNVFKDFVDNQMPITNEIITELNALYVEE